MHTVAEFVAALEAIAPLSLAAEWDNVGLLLGDPAAPVERVMTCLTVTPDSASEAIERGVQLIVSHHPILFRATKKLTTANAEGRIVVNLVQAGVAVYSAHSAYDDCAGGINDQLAQKLGLQSVEPLRLGATAAAFKIVVFTPDKDLAKVSAAMFAAGAGHIGQYRECSFRLAGTGTFFGADETNPTIGEKGRREEVAEWRLEVLCASGTVDRVVTALRAAHSYEEPAYDVYPLRPERGNSGAGRFGVLPAPLSLGDFARLVKNVLPAPRVEIAGPATQRIERVALACGAAAEFLNDAAARKADAFLTGEARFHDVLSAQTRRIGLILPGHYASERGGVEDLAARLQKQFADLEVWASRRECDPLAGV